MIHTLNDFFHKLNCFNSLLKDHNYWSAVCAGLNNTFTTQSVNVGRRDVFLSKIFYLWKWTVISWEHVWWWPYVCSFTRQGPRGNPRAAGAGEQITMQRRNTPPPAVSSPHQQTFDWQLTKKVVPRWGCYF